VIEDPRVIAVAGDWHGSAEWALAVVDQVAEEHPEIGLILHAGDFGIWPGQGGAVFLRKLNARLEKHGLWLWFVDGNHDDHDRIGKYERDADGLGIAAPRIRHLPRGYRWRWHDRVWLALGGAVSIDRTERVEGLSWWPGEEITDADVTAACAGGPVSVMLTHDCPAGVTHTFGPQPQRWLPDIVRTEKHRQRLQGVVDRVKPAYLIHGHLHRSYERWLDVPWGRMRVTGFDCDGAWSGNWAPLDVRTMEWVR
jgi:hypothetical protein